MGCPDVQAPIRRDEGVSQASGGDQIRWRISSDFGKWGRVACDPKRTSGGAMKFLTTLGKSFFGALAGCALWLTVMSFIHPYALKPRLAFASVFGIAAAIAIREKRPAMTVEVSALLAGGLVGICIAIASWEL